MIGERESEGPNKAPEYRDRQGRDGRPKHLQAHQPDGSGKEPHEESHLARRGVQMRDDANASERQRDAEERRQKLQGPITISPE